MPRGSLAHGVPPTISPRHYDTLLPSEEDLSSLYGEEQHQKSSATFLALCQLTEVLARLLPLAYDLRGISRKEVQEALRVVETELVEWEEALPQFWKRDSTSQLHVSGSSNLHLSFLSLKMLACLVSLHVRLSKTPNRLATCTN